MRETTTTTVIAAERQQLKQAASIKTAAAAAKLTVSKPFIALFIFICSAVVFFSRSLFFWDCKKPFEMSICSMIIYSYGSAVTLLKRISKYVGT